jgi:hypothetical protein
LPVDVFVDVLPPLAKSAEPVDPHALATTTRMLDSMLMERGLIRSSSSRPRNRWPPKIGPRAF